MSRDWKPVRRGKIYCSPACGAKCTFAAYEQANAVGNLVLFSLNNRKGWKVRVWENMGWHVSLENQSMFIHWSQPILGKPRFFVCGPARIVPHGSFPSAQRALNALRAKIASEIKYLEEVMS